MARTIFLLVLITFGFSYAAVLPNNKDERSVDSKLSQLEDLVNEIKNAREQSPSQHTGDDSRARESDMVPPIISDAAQTQQKSGLSPDEIALLQRLKVTLEDKIKDREDGLKLFEESVQQEKRPEHIGTFLDRPILEQKTIETDRLKQLAALMSQRSNSPKEDGLIDGRKNSFRENLLNVLVDRLLVDTDLLLRKGFSLDDVLKNLSEKAQKENERTSLEQTLEKLLNQHQL